MAKNRLLPWWINNTSGLITPAPASASSYLILYAYFNGQPFPLSSETAQVLISPVPNNVAPLFPLYNSNAGFTAFPSTPSRDAQLTNIVVGNKYFNGLTAWNGAHRAFEVEADWAGDQYTTISIASLLANTPLSAFPVTTGGFVEPYLTLTLLPTPGGILYDPLFVMAATVQSLDAFSFNGFNLGLIVNDAVGRAGDLFQEESMDGNFVPSGFVSRTGGSGSLYIPDLYSATLYSRPFVDASSFFDVTKGRLTMGMISLNFNVA